MSRVNMMNDFWIKELLFSENETNFNNFSKGDLVRIATVAKKIILSNKKKK